MGRFGPLTDDAAPPFGVDLHHMEGRAAGYSEPLACPTREKGHGVVAAEHAPAAVDDVTRLPSLGPQPLDETSVGSARHKADILTVGLVCDPQAEMPRQGTSLVFGEAAQWKPQVFELLSPRGEQEIALVARQVACPMEFGPLPTGSPAGIMPGGERRGAEIARRAQPTAKLDPLIAADARHRRFAPGVAVDKIVDHGSPEAALVIGNIMWNAEALCDAGRIVDVAPGAAGAAAPCRGAKIVDPQADSDHPESPSAH